MSTTSEAREPRSAAPDRSGRFRLSRLTGRADDQRRPAGVHLGLLQPPPVRRRGI